MIDTHDSVDSVEKGNTKPSQNPRARSWCFTWNNYPSTWEVDSVAHFEKQGWEYIIGEEVGKSGTPHLQGYIYSKNQIWFSSLKKQMPQVHWEKARGRKTDNYKYCSKDGKFVTNIEDLGEGGKKKNAAFDEYELFMKEEYKEVQWHPWQQQVLQIIESKPDRRKVYWFWEPEGNHGKSFLSKYIDWKFDAIIANGKQSDVFNQYKMYLEEEKKQPKVALLDIPRSHQEYVCYSTLEKIKDGLVYSGKYEGGKLRLIPHHLIVFANFEPDYKKLSQDRWDVTCIEDMPDEISN